jgi:sarcosine oxidase subunit gamma
MVEPAPVSPLAHRTGDLARVSPETHGAVSAIEVGFLAQVDLRLASSEVSRASFALPVEPNTTSSSGERTVLWLGPDQWLVVGPPWTQDEIAAKLASDLPRQHASIVDTSANRAVLEIGGPRRHELLSKGCSIDFDARAWGPATCAQTLLGRAQVILEERTNSTRVYVRPSFAEYLVEWVLDAVMEFRKPDATH